MNAYTIKVFTKLLLDIIELSQILTDEQLSEYVIRLTDAEDQFLKAMGIYHIRFTAILLIVRISHKLPAWLDMQIIMGRRL